MIESQTDRKEATREVAEKPQREQLAAACGQATFRSVAFACDRTASASTTDRGPHHGVS
jgi:hypothetical protein